jgi:hypothetical protein
VAGSGPTARDVFILGAGFSKAASSQLPLTQEIFPLCLEAMKDYHLETADDTETLEGFNRLGSDFEVWLSWLAGDQPWLDEASSMRNRAAFSDVSRGIASVILRAQNAALAASNAAPSWLVSLVRKWGQRHPSVITLNQDTLVEKTYETVVPMSALVLYSFGLATLSGAGRWGGSADEHFDLFKVHGSIGWYVFSGPSGRISPVYDGELTRGWNNGPDNEAALVMRVGGRVPLIVPPVLGKDQYFGLPELRDQWLRADLSLRHAQRVYVMGYSLPTADLSMRFLLDRIPTDCDIVPIDRDASLADRLERLFMSRRIVRDFVGRASVIPEFAVAYSGP